jgi:YVTN family beta-propeller protein
LLVLNHADIQWQIDRRRSLYPVDFFQMNNRRAFILGSAAALGCGRRRATAFPGYAFVANQGEQSIAVVDLTTFSVARQIRLEAAPSAIAADRQRRAVYVLAPQKGMVYEIDAVNLIPKRKLSLGAQVVSMRMAPAGGSLWFLCQEPHSLVQVELDRFQVKARLKLPNAPEDFDLNHDAPLAAVVFLEARSVALIDLAKPVVEIVAAAGEDPRAVRFRADGRQIFIGNRSARSLSVLDAKTGATLVRLPLPIEPENYCVTADGGQVFITGKGMDAVAIYHPYQTEISETLLAGRAPGAMAISAAPNEYLFAANPQSGDVTVLDVQTRTMLASVSVGQEPCYITFTPDNQYALVVNRHSGDLAVIRLSTLSNRKPRVRTVPLFTMIPVGSGPVCVSVLAV